MRAAWLMLPSLAFGAGCLRQTEFHCQTNEQCGANGTCQTAVGGYCSFPDSQCGQRYGDSAGSLAGQCVGGQTGSDGGVDTPMPDTPMVGCPADFILPTGAPAGSHVYKRLGTSANWGTQHDVCTGLAPRTYLAVPDDAAELTTIAMISQAVVFWVGVDDRLLEGTYVRSSDGMPATFKPWDTANGEPDNPGGGGGQDCVASTSTLFSTEDCSGNTANRPAVCECEP
jgi:hypothetical protein